MCLGKLVDTSWVVPNTKIPDDGSAGHPTDGGLLPRWNRFSSVFQIRIPPGSGSGFCPDPDPQKMRIRNTAFYIS